MNLVIVESPTKTKKLKTFLGKDFHIEASVGHVRDLPKSKLGVDIENGFKPTYVVSEDKKKVIQKLRSFAKKCKKVYLAMDPDREGEAIAWHVKYLLSDGWKAKDKPVLVFLRSTFHEITKPAVVEAIQNPHDINMDLVNAQQARRILDRLVGYKVSPVLWKKVKMGLSAGRVQSVALRLIVEREREIQAFKPVIYFEIKVATLIKKDEPKKVFEFKDEKLKIKNLKNILVLDLVSVDDKKLTKTKNSPIKTKEQAEEVLKDLEKASFRVSLIEKKTRKKKPSPPFITSSMQQASAVHLGFSAKQTMVLAQQLYENGLITYHRTDSVALSKEAIAMARDFISKNFDKKYLPKSPRIYKSKSKNAQEAHEAIRITHIDILPDELLSKYKNLTKRHQKLYDLIFKKFIASQMEDAVYENTNIKVLAQNNKKYLLKATGSVLVFDGWTKLFKPKEDVLLPKVEDKQELFYSDAVFEQKQTQPKPRYNDASLVRELEKRGIGRPSTYASIIGVIIQRGYVERKEKKFFPTPIGITVNDFLMKHFEEIMDYDFTAKVEDDLDKIARGEEEWKKVVAKFWKPLSLKIEKSQGADRMKIPVEETGEMCPLCGKTHGGKVVIRTGKYGKFKSCSRYPECKYTENIIEKVEGVKCPLCQKGDVIVKRTRRGIPFYGCSRYPECNWASWRKPKPGATITKQQWEEIQNQRKKRFNAKSTKKTNKKATKKTKS